jgi:hypothetical protein
MKLPLVAGGALVTALLVGCGGATSRYVMRVDQTFDRTAAQQPRLPSEDLPRESYRPETPVDRWEVAIDGSKILLTPIGEHPTKVSRLEGKEVPSARNEERRFDLDGAPAGGRFLVRGDGAELTLFGSGVPVVSSERGKLVTR